jgi:hypothetical protein
MIYTLLQILAKIYDIDTPETERELLKQGLQKFCKEYEYAGK